MKSDLFIRALLIIIVTLLALNIILPTLSNPTTSYAAQKVEYKIIDASTLETPQQLEIFFNELAKEGWEFIQIEYICYGSFNNRLLVIFKR